MALPERIPIESSLDAEELSDDELELVIGGLARPWPGRPDPDDAGPSVPAQRTDD